MKAILTAEISVCRASLFAEMAWLERRPELGLLCRAALAHGRQLTEAVVQSVVPGLSDAGASNVIRWCASLGLCDRNGGLTSLADTVAETDEAPVPEQGIYRFWMASHPVIGRRILAAERVNSGRRARFSEIAALPLEPDHGKVFDSVVAPAERYILRDLPKNHDEGSGCIVEATSARCFLRWTLDFERSRDSWTLDGFIEARPIQHDAEADGGVDLERVIESWGPRSLEEHGHWCSQKRLLEVDFSGLGRDEISEFKKTLELTSVEVLNKGCFETAVLEDVPIGPADAKAAQTWAMTRFARALHETRRFRSRHQVRTLFAELVEDTPLEAHRPELPSHAQLLDELVDRREQFWGLAAAVDLAPQPVDHKELSSLRIGEDHARERIPREPEGIVRIPYRGGWSMRQLVDRLLVGTRPESVLLCDRYVRGEGNLRTLDILVTALREACEEVRVEVWTSEDEADFDRIRSVTGSAPRSYREVFGHAVPHDRYFVVRAPGRPFGWHMSNSPLHARIVGRDCGPADPLRWKDLLGTRVASEQLEPALRQWAVRRAGP